MGVRRKAKRTVAGIEIMDQRPSRKEKGYGFDEVVSHSVGGRVPRDDAVCVLVRIRDGKVVAREHRFLENVENERDEDVLSAFAIRYYLPSREKARRIVLPFPPADVNALEEVVAPARLVFPQRGTAHRWLELADQNVSLRTIETLCRRLKCDIADLFPPESAK